MNLLLRLPPLRPARTEMSWRAELRAWWTTSRPEFAIAPSLSQAGVAALLALHQRSLDLEFAWRLIVGLGIWWVSISVGASLNCIADYETDRLDRANKARLARAIDIVGSTRLWRIILAEIGILALAIVVLALLLKLPLLLGLWLTGLLLAFMYSFEPYRIKGRGFLSPVTASCTCVVLPMLFIYYLLASQAFGPALVVICLFGVQSCGLMLVEQVSDYEEDKSRGTLTASVRYGRYRTIRLAAIVYALASAEHGFCCLALLASLDGRCIRRSPDRIGILHLDSAGFSEGSRPGVCYRTRRPGWYRRVAGIFRS